MTSSNKIPTRYLQIPFAKRQTIQWQLQILQKHFTCFLDVTHEQEFLKLLKLTNLLNTQEGTREKKTMSSVTYKDSV